MLQMKATVFLVSFTFPPISLDLIFHSSNIDHAKLENRQIFFSMEIMTTMQVLLLFCSAVYIKLKDICDGKGLLKKRMF